MKYLLLAAALLPVLSAQVCRISVAGLNRNRRVIGPVHAECPFTIHTPPFGNWGVTSNFGQKGDSRQFEGWCRDTRVCDNSGNCSVHCTDGHYEWNSCTDVPQYQPPNQSLYNAGGTQQVTATGINVHGTRTVDVPAACPTDTNNDGIAETGGCSSLTAYSSGVNFMSLYELDPGTADDLIQTLYFPEIRLATGCTIWRCPPASSPWTAPSAYDSPTAPAKVFAEMAMVLNSGVFIDTARACRIANVRAESVSAATFRPGPHAPAAIASVFGDALATSQAVAAAQPLPTTLAGTTVTVTDSAGAARRAPLFYVSPGQVNYQVPEGTAAGEAVVSIAREDGIGSRAAISVAPAAPGLFAANANGQGVAAAVAVRVAAAGTQQTVRVFECAPEPLSCRAIPLDLGAPGEQLILLLFGTGLRHAPAPVEVTIGGIRADLLYAGAQGQFAGLDQLNVRIPAALRGRGEVAVVVSAGGRTANPVTISVR